MDKEDFLVMVVAAGKDKPLTPVQVQKSLFLIAQQVPGLPEDFYEFEPYHYGPFNRQIYQDADALRETGMVWRMKHERGGWTDTIATYSGRERAVELEKELDAEVVKYIHDVVEWTQRLSFSELVSAIYRDYPDYRQNSVFQD